MSKIRVGELVRVLYGSRATKFPGFPSINDAYTHVNRGDVLIAVADEFVYRHKMMGGRDLEEPYVAVLIPDKNVYFVNPRCLSRVTQQESADKIGEKEFA